MKALAQNTVPAQRPEPASHQLTIVIPALDEEEAIGATIERCLAARETLTTVGGVDTVRIVVVSDGSTDRTPEIARSYDEVDVIVFPENRGYGAAIKAGWNHGGGNLLAFLDADGTCDPEFFAPMCRAAIDDGNDVVLGCRMGADSQMPRTRRIGNTIFAILLGLLSRKKVRDTASGMRIVQAKALPRLLPLPDGLHFTPAMSARALIDGDVSITEIDMRYEERVGRSKLHVVRDGLRFLRVILSTAAYMKVSRLTTPLILLLTLCAGLLMVGPLRFYLAASRLEEWMLYRFALAGTLCAIATTALCATVVAEHVSALTHLRYDRFGARSRGLWRYRNLKWITIAAGALWSVAAALNAPGLIELLTTGHVTLHWSRVMLGAFFTIALAQCGATWVTVKIIRALHQRQPYLQRREDR